MRNRLLNISGIAIVLVSVMFTGCVTPEKKAPLKFLPMTEQEIPGDAELVAAAVLTRMNGFNISKELGVSFKEGVNNNLDTPEFDYSGFIIMGHRLYQYAERPEGKPGRLVAGQLDLGDFFGRRAKLDYIAQYDLTDSGLVIEEAETQAVYATDPNVELFLVPVADAEKEKSKYPKTWAGLYMMAKDLNVLPVEDAAKEQQAKKHLLFLFLKDRTAPSARTTLRLADQKTSDIYYGWENESKYFDLKGWRVAAAAGKFPAKPENDFWIKLVFSPGKEAGSRTRRIIYHEDLRKIATK